MNRQGIGTGGRLRAVLGMLLVVSLLGSLVAAQTASARTLSERLAERTAIKLVKKQLKDRDRRLVEARITAGERQDRNTWLFLYDDLSRRGEVCTATIEVRLVPPGGNRIVGRFRRGSNCARPGSEALAFRTAARLTAVAFVRRERAVLRSVSRFIESAEACESLNIPDDREDEALLLLSTGLTQATIRPLSGTLDRYATALQAVAADDDQLAAGAAAWRDFVDAVRSLPRFSPSYCAVLSEWAANGYTDESAPVDFAALRAISERIQDDGAEVRRTARRLTAKGIDPVTATAFTLDNLIGDTALGDPRGSTLGQARARLSR